MNQEPIEVTATEDLMREHGLLNRVLLIYQEIGRRLELGDCQFEALGQAVGIIETFIENYHEKMEEEFLFPLFRKNNVEVGLVDTLLDQHQQGRKITAALKELINSNKCQDPKERKQLQDLLKQFIDMYRPHEAREDTVLFPLVRSLLTPKAFDELGKQMEDLEHTLFGERGFETMVEKVVEIEKHLGIYELEQFTPSQIDYPK